MGRLRQGVEQDTAQAVRLSAGAGKVGLRSLHPRTGRLCRVTGCLSRAEVVAAQVEGEPSP